MPAEKKSETLKEFQCLLPRHIELLKNEGNYSDDIRIKYERLKILLKLVDTEVTINSVDYETPLCPYLTDTKATLAETLKEADIELPWLQNAQKIYRNQEVSSIEDKVKISVILIDTVGGGEGEHFVLTLELLTEGGGYFYASPETNPLLIMDKKFKGALETAISIAKYKNLFPDNKDVRFTLTTQGNENYNGILVDTSMGAAFAACLIELFSDFKDKVRLDKTICISATINKSGMLGNVGEIHEKLKIALAKEDICLIIISENQKISENQEIDQTLLSKRIVKAQNISDIPKIMRGYSVGRIVSREKKLTDEDIDYVLSHIVLYVLLEEKKFIEKDKLHGIINAIKIKDIDGHCYIKSLEDNKDINFESNKNIYFIKLDQNQYARVAKFLNNKIATGEWNSPIKIDKKKYKIEEIIKKMLDSPNPNTNFFIQLTDVLSSPLPLFKIMEHSHHFYLLSLCLALTTKEKIQSYKNYRLFLLYPVIVVVNFLQRNEINVCLLGDSIPMITMIMRKFDSTNDIRKKASILALIKWYFSDFYYIYKWLLEANNCEKNLENHFLKILEECSVNKDLKIEWICKIRFGNISNAFYKGMQKIIAYLESIAENSKKSNQAFYDSQSNHKKIPIIKEVQILKEIQNILFEKNSPHRLHSLQKLEEILNQIKNRDRDSYLKFYAMEILGDLKAIKKEELERIEEELEKSRIKTLENFIKEKNIFCEILDFLEEKRCLENDRIQQCLLRLMSTIRIEEDAKIYNKILNALRCSIHLTESQKWFSNVLEEVKKQENIVLHQKLFQLIRLEKIQKQITCVYLLSSPEITLDKSSRVFALIEFLESIEVEKNLRREALGSLQKLVPDISEFTKLYELYRIHSDLQSDFIHIFSEMPLLFNTEQQKKFFLDLCKNLDSQNREIFDSSLKALRRFISKNKEIVNLYGSYEKKSKEILEIVRNDIEKEFLDLILGNHKK
ncbi:MAG: hypothetical protein HUU50_00195 [Candidatus Brocadiae bacterium]|nr:hypothetical protein [Candidatus Brocadiia bacterium]